MGGASPDVIEHHEPVLRWANRLNPVRLERWQSWRNSLGPELQERIPRLEALLGGICAFRHLENLSAADLGPEFQPHVSAFHAACARALSHTVAIMGGSASRVRKISVGHANAEHVLPDDPETCLEALHDALRSAERISAKLASLESIESASFHATVDILLNAIATNPYFSPPKPLEFISPESLVNGGAALPSLKDWRCESAHMTMSIAILALVRAHKRLQWMEELVDSDDPGACHVLMAGVRSELRALTRFLLSQGIESLAQEFETRLLETPAHRLTAEREQLRATSERLVTFRQELEQVALGLHTETRKRFDNMLPALGATSLDPTTVVAQLGRFRAHIKQTAARLRTMTIGTGAAPLAQPAAVRLRDEVWTFRFILRAFSAKASGSSVAADFWDQDAPATDFIPEFCRHFRVFAPRVGKATAYPRNAAMMRCIAKIERADAPTAEELDAAAHEALCLARHLDHAFVELDGSDALRDKPFNKRAAASALRHYLTSVRQLPLGRTFTDQPAANANAVGAPDGVFTSTTARSG